MLHRVLQQLGKSHRQRGRQPGVEHSEISGAARAHAWLGRGRRQPSRAAGPLPVEVDGVVHRLGQRVVHDRDGADPSHSLLERGSALSRADPPRLQSQQGRHCLQVVLHPVMDLADGRILGDQLAFTPSYLGHVTAQHQGADVLPAGVQRDNP